MDNKTIRNPSLAELKEAQEVDMTVGTPTQKKELETPKQNEMHWKPALSKFDPKPVFFRLPSGNATGCEHIEKQGIYVKRFSTATEGMFGEAIARWRESADHASFFSRLNLILDQCIR